MRSGTPLRALAHLRHVHVHFDVDVTSRIVAASYGTVATQPYPFLDMPDAASVDDLRVGIENVDRPPLTDVDVSIDQLRCTVVR